MPAEGIQYEQVEAAANAIVASKERPTLDRVRAKLGTGSKSTIHKYMKKWRDAQPLEKRHEPKLSDDLAQALASHIEKEAAEARATAENERDEYKAEAESLCDSASESEEERDEALALVDEFKAKLGEMTGRADEKAKEIDRLNNELRDVRVTLTAELSKVRENLARAETQVEAKNEELSRAHADAERQRTDLAEARRMITEAYRAAGSSAK